MTRLKVLQLTGSDFALRCNLRRLVSGMTEAGWEVVCATHDSGHFNELQELGFDVRPLPFMRTKNPLVLLRVMRAICSLIVREKFDVVHLHHPLMGYVGRVAAWLARAPLVVYTAHGFYFSDRTPWWKKQILFAIEKLVSHWTHVLFCQSSENAKLAIAKGWYRPEKVLVIGNGINLSSFNPAGYTEESRRELKRELNIPPSNRVVGVTGRMTREKGFTEFVRAAGELSKRFPDVSFLVVGAPLAGDRQPLTIDELSAMAREHGVADRVIFTGFRSDMPRLLSIMDVFTLPSYREGMPRAVIEAMAMSVPVVATDIDGCREEIYNEVEGLLVPVRDHHALAGGIARLLADPQYARAMGERGRERALRQFDEEKVVALQINTISELAAQMRRPAGSERPWRA